MTITHSFHQEEPEKANIVAGKTELTVYFRFENGENSAQCHYCQNPGQEQVVVVDVVEHESVPVDRGEKLFETARKKVEKLFFHGRGVCDVGPSCDDEFLHDFLGAKAEAEETA